MKRIMAAFLTAVLCISLWACDGTGSPPLDQNPTEPVIKTETIQPEPVIKTEIIQPEPVIKTETIQLNSTNFRKYFFIETETSKFSVDIINVLGTNFEDGYADCDILVGQKVAGTLNNVKVTIRVASYESYWSENDPIEVTLNIPVGGSASKSLSFEASTFYYGFNSIKKPEFSYYILDASGTITIETLESNTAPGNNEAQHSDVVTLIEQGDFLQASNLLFENPEISDYADLMSQCGQGVLQQYIQENGKETQTGTYFLNLLNEDGTQIKVWYYVEDNLIDTLHSFSSNGVGDYVGLKYVVGSGIMSFSRSTSNLGPSLYSQEGTINISEYTGSYIGDLVDNSPMELVVPGMTITKAQPAYNEQTKEYRVESMRKVNEILNALFEAVADAGYKGTISDIGFTAYEAY